MGYSSGVTSGGMSRTHRASMSAVKALSSKFRIDSNAIRINFMKVIGGGKFGKILAAEYNGASCCAKQIDDFRTYLTEGDLFFEVSTHPNICRYFGYITLGSDHFIVMERFDDKSVLETYKQGHCYTFHQKC